MEKENMLKTFAEEYRAIGKTVNGGRDKLTQGKLYQKYIDKGLSQKEISGVIRSVDDSDIKESSIRRKISESLNLYKKSLCPTVESAKVPITQAALSELSKLTIDDIIKEIHAREYNINQNMLEIGMCLKEAKKHVAHGEWDTWLKSNTSISRKTAAKLMQCVDRFANDALASHLEISKMEELLSLPKGDTQEFLDSCEIKGQPVKNMTKMELRAEVKQWKNRNKEDICSEVTLEVVTEENSAANLSDTIIVTENVDVKPIKTPEYIEFSLKILKGEEQLFQDMLMTALEQDKTLSETSREHLLESIANIA